jgi:hypothetical protein
MTVQVTLSSPQIWCYLRNVENGHAIRLVQASTYRTLLTVIRVMIKILPGAVAQSQKTTLLCSKADKRAGCMYYLDIKSKLYQEVVHNLRLCDILESSLLEAASRSRNETKLRD